jgi:hypothetical protein
VSFRFWQRWLQCVGVGSGLLGLAFLTAPGSAMLAAYNRQVVEAFHGAEAPPSPAALEQQHWAIAVVGSAMVGWAILLVAVATVPLGRREPWAWYSIALSIAAWAATDSVVSYRAGVYLEVIFNGVVAILVALPLAMTYGAVVTRGAAGTVGGVGPRRLDDAAASSRRSARKW